MRCVVAHVPEVQSVEVFRFQGAGGARLLVHASGEVETSGWSRLRLSPRFYAEPPADGLWEFDFEGDPPYEPALELVLPAAAETTMGMPDWLQGVKVYGAAGSQTTLQIEPAALVRHPPAVASFSTRPGMSMVRQLLVSYDDRFSPAGWCGSFGTIQTKKLHHELTMTVFGPDEAKIRRCVADATGIGFVAAAAVAYADGGGALFAAVSRLLTHLHDGLGDAYNVRIDDQTNWIEWCA